MNLQTLNEITSLHEAIIRYNAFLAPKTRSKQQERAEKQDKTLYLLIFLGSDPTRMKNGKPTY